MTKTGFVCPKWAIHVWNPNECMIEETTESGTYVILDHSIQTVIYVGSLAECRKFSPSVRTSAEVDEMLESFSDEQKLAAGTPVYRRR